MRHGLHGRAHHRKRHPGTAQKRHEQAKQVAHTVEQLFARTQARKGKANGQRRARQGKRRRQRQAHATHTDLGNRAGKAHDAHHARHKPDTDGEHGGGREHGKRTLALGDWAGIHTMHALGLVHARKHQPHRHDDRRDDRVRTKVEIRLECGGGSRVDLDPLNLDLGTLGGGMLSGLGDTAVRGDGLQGRRSACERDPPRGLGRRKRRRHGAGAVGHIEPGQFLPRTGGRDQVVLKPLRDKEHAIGMALGAVALGERVRKIVRIVADARDQVKARTQVLGKRPRKIAVVAVDHDHVGIARLVVGELRRV